MGIRLIPQRTIRASMMFVTSVLCVCPETIPSTDSVTKNRVSFVLRRKIERGRYEENREGEVEVVSAQYIGHSGSCEETGEGEEKGEDVENSACTECGFSCVVSGIGESGDDRDLHVCFSCAERMDGG